MASTRNNSQARKAKEKSGWLCRWLAILVKPICWLWQWLDKRLDRWLILFIVILIIVFVVFIFSDPVPAWVSRLLDNKDKREALALIGIGIGSMVLWQRAVSAGQQAEAMKDAACNQAEGNKLTEASHTQERLKTSIEHLGSAKESVRIGAAYELYHLAKDRKKYRETVCDISCGHIRQKTQEENYRKQQKKKNEPTEEIKTFLNLLCRKEEEKERDEGGLFREHQIDLSSSFLQKTNLSGARLNNAILSRAHLRGANLLWVELQWADLQQAHLQRATLSGAHLRGADLLEAQLQETDLSWAELQWTNLSGAHLQGADLSDARLQGADLSDARLQGADLSDARLQGADLSGAHLQGADLSGAHLQGADLSGVKLQGISSSGELSKMSLQDKIRARTGKKSDFTNVVFSGGLDADQAEEIIASMPAGLEDKIKEGMKNKMNEHVDKEAGHKLPDNSGAITGTYNKDEAEEWITDYEKSTSRQPAKDK